MQPEKAQPNKLIGMALVNVATFTWATNMALGRWLAGSIGPITLAAARFLIASLLFAILLRRRPPSERRLGEDRWLLVGMGLSGVAIFGPMLYLGLHFTTAVNATLINGLGPLVTGLLASILIQESMSRRQVAGALAGLTGVAIMITGGRISLRLLLHRNMGDLIVLGAITLWGIYSILGRRVMSHRSALSATALSTLLAVPFLLIAAAWETCCLPISWHAGLVLAIAYIGIVPAVIGFVSWNEGVRRLGPSGAMMFYNTLLLYGALLGHFFLREPTTLSHLVGGALIIGGGLWAARGRR
ncbi:MAG: DMT family transporter [Anaerolineae bacterium]|nr:DMT family transporter [Anaerolineae bacterium]